MGINRNTIIVQSPKERAFLVTVVNKSIPQEISADASQDELEQLAKSAGVEVVGRTVQNLPVPSNAYYAGKGKLDEIKSLKETLNYNLVIFDDELQPVQQRNLEEILQVKVIDRVALILEIFARRAMTREGKLQVELAQHQYLLPRLSGQWSHLERLGGGIGTRGPGESQLETDRRLIRRRIQRLEEQIEKVRGQRLLYRQRRQKSRIPIIALVGYTNAGKSTLLNAISQAAVANEDKPFTTLDTTTRRVRLPGGQAALLSDTVGFIRKLPPTIISAFQATLEELEDANLLLNIVDFSSRYAPEELHTVEGILQELGLKNKLRITVLNKIDRVLEKSSKLTEDEALSSFRSIYQQPNPDTVFVSATKKWGFSQLLECISRALGTQSRLQA